MDAIVLKEFPNYGIVLIAAMLLFISGPAALLVKRVKWIPQSVITTILAVFIGILFVNLIQKVMGDDVVLPMPDTSSHFTDIYASIYITSTMYRINYSNFIKHLPQTCLMSIYSAIISPLVLAVVMYKTLYGFKSFNCIVIRALAFVPIEPLYSVHVLKRLARYKHLETLLEAESVLSLVPLYFMIDIFTGIQTEYLTEWYHVAAVLGRKIILGFIIGYIAGKLHTVMMIYSDSESFALVGVSMCMTYITYYVTEAIAAGSGQIAIICQSCMIVDKRHKLPPNVEANMLTAWVTMHYLCETVLLSLVVIRYTIYFLPKFGASYLYRATLTYLANLLLRFAGFFIISTIMQKQSKELNLKGILVLSWSGTRGPLALNFATMFIRCADEVATDMYIFDIFFIALVTNIINNSTVGYLLKLVGYEDLSLVQKDNINVYLNMLNQSGENIIYILKYCRYFTSASWDMVRIFVKLKYSPFKHEKDKKEHIVHVKPCEGCEIDVPYNISEQELADLLNENEIKLNKLKKIFIMKQYFQGSINKHCLDLLTVKIERKFDHSKRHFAHIDLQSYFKATKFEVSCKLAMDKFHMVMGLTPPPKSKPSRQLAFYVTQNIAYDFVLYTITCINSIFIISNNGNCCSNWMFKYHFGLFSFYALDFLLKIYGLSHKRLLLSAFNQYFTSITKWVEFLCLILTIINLCGPSANLYKWIVFYCIPGFRLIALLRLLLIECFLHLAAPLMYKYLKHRLNARASFGYQLGTALIQCNEGVISILPEIIELKTIRDVLKEELLTSVAEWEKELAELEILKPYIPLTVKTKQVIQITLNGLIEKLHKFERFNTFEVHEYNFIAKLLIRQQLRLRKLKYIQPYKTHEVLNNIPWISSAQYEHFWNNLKIKSWDVGDVVQLKGRVTDGIYLIVSGIAHLYYKLKDRNEEHIKYGELPIIDNLTSYDFRQTIDTVLPGGLIGELSYITKRAYSCNVVADSYCVVYWLPHDLLEEARKTDNNPVNGLECRIWKNCCLNIAASILMKIPVYKKLSKADIRNTLRNCFVPNLNCYKTFICTEKINHIILIEGKVKSVFTDTFYVAPTLIPKPVLRIQLAITPDDYKFDEADVKIYPKLIIVPVEGFTDVDIMAEEENIAEFKIGTTSKYVLMKKILPQEKSSLTTATVRNLISESMISYNWEDDKEIIHLDSDQDSRIGSNYDITKRMSYLLKSRKIHSTELSASLVKSRSANTTDSDDGINPQSFTK